MKTSTLLRLNHWITAFFCAVLLVARSYAGLQIPYSPDANTVHLWHFDGSFTNLDGTTNVLTPDTVSVGAITLTNVAQTNIPGSKITLGNLSITGLSNCLHIIPTNLATGNTFAFAYGGGVTNSDLLNQSSGGAFTFEAIIKMDISPFATTGSAQNWEIVSGDNSNNGTGVRGWQFRITTGLAAAINFNAAPGLNANVNNFTFPLPNSGPNAVAAGQWYHVAVTFTGTSPTNSDTANVFTLYWTLLDANRTYPDVLAVTNVQSGFGIVNGVVSQLGVGGNGRANNGIANNEGFKGYIDEVRMSVVARSSNEMAFTTGGALNAPSFASQPPTNTFIGYGQILTLPTVVVGTLPISYQWQQDGGTGYTNAPGQTNNTLVISNVTFAAAGDYRLVATNGLGSTNSSVAHVSIGASFAELFQTGVETNGDLLAGGVGVIDPHYQLIQSDDPANLGPDATVWDMANAPLKSNSGRFANADSVSDWIGPNNFASSPNGLYTYQTHFLINQGSVSTATLQGTFWVNLGTVNVLLNGISQGAISANKNDLPGSLSFTVTNGLVAGLNTLTFITTNSATAQDPQSAFRAELFGLAQALPPGLPVITNQPVNVTVRENGRASFSVVALGRPPLRYQWYADNVLLSGATNRTLAFDSVTTGGQGSSFKVVVNNDSGPVTSSTATLTLTTNRPPIPPTITIGTLTNTPVNVSIGTLVYGTIDPDLDPISFVSVDGTSTNGGSIVQNGINLTYTPVTDFAGADQFSYVVTDQTDSPVGYVNIIVSPLMTPSFSSSVLSGSNVIFGGTGGAPGTSYRVLTSTNLSVGITNWTQLTTGNFNLSGQFHLTNAITPGVPRSFYMLQVP